MEKLNFTKVFPKQNSKPNFIDGILKGEKLIAPAKDARRAVDLILSIYKSAETQTWVDVPKFD